MNNVGYEKNIINSIHEYNINTWFETPFQYLAISGNVFNGVIDRKQKSKRNIWVDINKLRKINK